MQTKFRGNLSAANFPLVSDFMGRSVVIPQYDANFQRRKQFSGDDSDLDIGIPQVYYCHNVMPMGQGFKSIAYKMVVRPVVGILNFERVFLAKDPEENKALIGITATGGVFIYASGATAWVDITAAAGGWTGGVFSVAYANGYTYLCLSKFNTFKVNVLAKTLTPVVFSGITMSGIVGICASNNYLICYDTVTVYWSSATNPEDFIPSLVTGSGSGTPQDINGMVVCVLPLGTGYAVYTTTNIILSSYSGNLRYPWIFRQAQNGSGVIKVEHIASDGDQGTNYAWTSAGLLKVTMQGCTTPFPEITDFLSGRIFEDYNSTTDTFESQYLSDQLLIEVSFVSSRYLVLSYGITSLTHALVYDTSLKRWGKLKVDHVAVFELSTDAEADMTYEQLAETIYDDYETIAYDEMTTLANTAAKAKRTVAFMQRDGTVKLAVWDFGNYSAEGVFILGKYQLTRTQTCTLQGLSLESMDTENTNLAVKVLTTLDGKTITGKMTPAEASRGTKIRDYNCRATGENHSIVIKGAFNLVSVLIILSRGGRR